VLTALLRREVLKEDELLHGSKPPAIATSAAMSESGSVQQNLIQMVQNFTSKKLTKSTKMN
jgi:hypothetical protein